MYINQTISQEEKQNILLASEESLKSYSKLYKKNMVIFSIALIGAIICSFNMLLYSMYRHAVLLMALIPVALIQLKTFNDGYKLRKLLKDFSNTEEDYCNLYEHRVIANNECITINDKLSINWKNILVTFLYKNYVIVVSEDKKYAIMRLDYNMRKAVVDMAKSYNAFLILMDTEKDNMELAKKHINKAKMKNNILIVFVLVLMCLFIKLL